MLFVEAVEYGTAGGELRIVMENIMVKQKTIHRVRCEKNGLGYLSVLCIPVSQLSPNAAVSGTKDARAFTHKFSFLLSAIQLESSKVLAKNGNRKNTLEIEKHILQKMIREEG